ncbi:MAG: aldehyde dehydrogenase, partial [Acetobacteraceae bacterium]|nr:aldehyde dehydrogenase [Acetobacteraceae bacterium]
MLDRPVATPQAPSLDERALAIALSGKHFIGGQFVAPIAGKHFDVVNPATGEKVAEAADG